MAEIVDLMAQDSVYSTDPSSESSSESSDDVELLQLTNKYAPSSYLNPKFGDDNNIGTQYSTDSSEVLSYPIYNMNRFIPAHAYTSIYGEVDSLSMCEERSFTMKSGDATSSTDRSWQDSGAQAPDSSRSVQKSL